MADLSVYQRVTPLNRLQELSQREQFAINQAKEQQRMAKELQLAKIKQMETEQASGGGGATGELIRLLQAEKPDLSTSDALAMIQTGYRKGLQFTPEGITPLAGYGESVSKLAGMESGATEEAKLRQQLQLKPEIVREEERARLGVEREKSAPSKARVTGTLDKMLGLYEQAQEIGALVDTDKSWLENVAARSAATGVGQSIGGFSGTKAQEIRDQIKTLKPTLINDIRQASEMGAKGMDSEKELEFYLQATTDEKRSLKTNLAAINVLNEAYGLGASKYTNPEEREKLRKEFSSKLGDRMSNKTNNINQGNIDPLGIR